MPYPLNYMTDALDIWLDISCFKRDVTVNVHESASDTLHNVVHIAKIVNISNVSNSNTWVPNSTIALGLCVRG